MEINEAYQNFDEQTMERLLQEDPMLHLAKRALDELGENRAEGLKVLYQTYVMGEKECALSLSN
ncbi:MAG: hypothetical protein V4507_00940 [Verrucomicrobiota bacterium]